MVFSVIRLGDGEIIQYGVMGFYKRKFVFAARLVSLWLVPCFGVLSAVLGVMNHAPTNVIPAQTLHVIVVLPFFPSAQVAQEIRQFRPFKKKTAPCGAVWVAYNALGGIIAPP